MAKKNPTRKPNIEYDPKHSLSTNVDITKSSDFIEKKIDRDYLLKQIKLVEDRLELVLDAFESKAIQYSVTTKEADVVKAIGSISPLKRISENITYPTYLYAMQKDGINSNLITSVYETKSTGLWGNYAVKGAKLLSNNKKELERMKKFLETTEIKESTTYPVLMQFVNVVRGTTEEAASITGLKVSVVDIKKEHKDSERGQIIGNQIALSEQLIKVREKLEREEATLKAEVIDTSEYYYTNIAGKTLADKLQFVDTGGRYSEAMKEMVSITEKESSEIEKDLVNRAIAFSEQTTKIVDSIKELASIQIYNQGLVEAGGAEEIDLSDTYRDKPDESSIEEYTEVITGDITIPASIGSISQKDLNDIRDQFVAVDEFNVLKSNIFWQDTVEIDGGNIRAGTITAGAVQIGLRPLRTNIVFTGGILTPGAMFDTNAPIWPLSHTAGYVETTDENNEINVWNIPESDSGTGVLLDDDTQPAMDSEYFIYAELAADNTGVIKLSETNPEQGEPTEGFIILNLGMYTTYSYPRVILSYGSTVINGSEIITGTLIADRIRTSGGNYTGDEVIAEGSVYIKYSATGVGTPDTDPSEWHDVFAQGTDIYQSQKTGVSGTWTDAIKVVGQDGQDGATGTTVTGFLTNESSSLYADGTWTIDYSYAAGTFMVFVGTTDKTGTIDVAYSVHSETDCDVSIASSGVYTVNSITNGEKNASATFKAVCSGVTLYRTLSLSVVQDGVDGEPGTPGGDGADGATHWLVTSSSIIGKSKAGAFTPTSVVFTSMQKIGTAEPTTYNGIFKIYENGSGTAAYTSGSPESVKSHNVPTGCTSLKCVLYENDGLVKLDEETIPVVFDGTDGISGTNGKTYVLNVLGGKRAIMYDANDSNPSPSMTNFTVELKEDGTTVTPSSWSWTVPSVNSLLSTPGGTPVTTASFTPTVANTFNDSYTDNVVNITVTYGSPVQTIRQTVPIAITKIGDTGQTGPSGTNGTNGKTYILNIYGGKTTITYNSSGASPAPTMSAFQCKLYENGVEVTPGSYSWTIPGGASSLLSGSSNSSSFTPTVAGTFDTNKADNTIRLEVTYSGQTIIDLQPVSITKIGTTGTAGTNGTRTAILDLYKWAASYPNTWPSGNSTYYWSNGSFDNPATLNGWTQTPSTTPTPGYTLYITRAIFSDTNNSATSSVPWPSSGQSAKAIGIAGEDGLNGNRTGFLEVYKWDFDMPAVPSGTSTYYWSDGTFTLPTGNTETYSLIPGDPLQGQTLWAASTRVTNSNTDSSSTATWPGTGDPYAIGFAGIDGNDGQPGTNGKTYILNIVGGTRTVLYDKDGLNPSTTTQMTCELYEDGVEVTPDTYDWETPLTNCLLTGTSSLVTFTPAPADIFNDAYVDNRVILEVTYGTQVIKQEVPISITKIGDTGITGPSGTNGTNGKTYILQIVGGTTSIIYDKDGENPLPTIEAFSLELFEDGVAKTPTAGNCTWSVPSANTMLNSSPNPTTGLSFTPTLDTIFDESLADNQVKLTVVYDGQTIKDICPISITKVGESGVDAIVGDLTNDSVTFPCDSSGNITGGLASGNGIFKIYNGLTDVTGTGTVYTVDAEVGCDVSINGTTGAYIVNSVSSATAYATFKCVYNTNTIIYKTFTIAKAVAGVTAKSISIYGPQTFKYDANVNPVGATSITLNVFKSNVSSTTYTWTYGLDGAAPSTTLTGTGVTFGTDSVTITNSATVWSTGKSITIKAVVDGVSDTFTIYKVYDGVTGSTGTEATTYWIDSTSPIIYKDSSSAGLDGVHTNITVTGKRTVGSTTATYGYLTVTANGASEATTATANTITTSIANNAAKTSYTVKLYNQATVSGATLLDTIVIPVVFKGSSEITAVLSNATHIFPATYFGAVTDYSNSGTQLRVYEGANELTLLNTTPSTDPATLAAGQWRLYSTPATTNITLGTLTDAGNYLNVSNATAGVANGTDSSSILYTINGKSLGGTPFIITQTQTFSKAKAATTEITIILSNQSHDLPANNDGTIVSGGYVGSGTNIQVLEGSSALTYKTSGTAASTFLIGTPVVNPLGKLTVGARTGVDTTTAVVADHSAMDAATDVVTVSYPISIYNASGTLVSGSAINVVQTLAKSKTGSDAVIYRMDINNPVIYKTTSGVFNPTGLLASAYRRIGNGTETAYSANWKIFVNSTQVSNDGDATSTSKTTYAYPAGYPMSGVMPSYTTSVTVYMYAGGGFTTLLDTQTIPIVSQGVTGNTGRAAVTLYGNADAACTFNTTTGVYNVNPYPSSSVLSGKTVELNDLWICDNYQLSTRAVDGTMSYKNGTVTLVCTAVGGNNGGAGSTWSNVDDVILPGKSSMNGGLIETETLVISNNRVKNSATTYIDADGVNVRNIVKSGNITDYIVNSDYVEITTQYNHNLSLDEKVEIIGEFVINDSGDMFKNNGVQSVYSIPETNKFRVKNGTGIYEIGTFTKNPNGATWSTIDKGVYISPLTDGSILKVDGGSFEVKDVYGYSTFVGGRYPTNNIYIASVTSSDDDKALASIVTVGRDKVYDEATDKWIYTGQGADVLLICDGTNESQIYKYAIEASSEYRGIDAFDNPVEIVQIRDIQFLDGAYDFDNKSFNGITSELVVIGSGPKTIIRRAYFWSEYDKNLTFINLNFENSQFETYFTDNLKFIGCKFYNNINLTAVQGGSSSFEFDNCIFENIEGYAIYLEGTSAAATTTITIKNCDFGNITGTAVRLTGNIDKGYVYNNSFIDCNTESYSGGAAISISGAGYGVAKNVRVTRNTLDDGEFGSATILVDSFVSNIFVNGNVANGLNAAIVDTSTILGELEPNHIGGNVINGVTKEANNKSILDLIYPVGSIYISVNSTNPGTLFGGTWQAFATGQTIVGVGTSDVAYAAGATGGASTVALSANNLPAHTHPIPHTHGTGSTGFDFLVADGNVAVNQTARNLPSTGGTSNIIYSAHDDSVTINENPNTGGTNTGSSSNNSTTTTAHNNMPPYIVTYIWKRTA